MKKIEIKEIKRKIYEIYGWSIREWAKRRGFSPQVVYFALRGDRRRAGGRRMREILQALKEDLREGRRKCCRNFTTKSSNFSRKTKTKGR